MTPSKYPIDELVAAVLDGAHLDWAQVESSDSTGAFAGNLKVVAAIAAACGQNAGVDAATFKTWGHLRIHERVGRGAFGEVYRAWDTRLEREVALKLIRVDGAPDGCPFPSVLREGRLLARVRHPNVVTIYGADQIGEYVGLWMEFVHGRSLEQMLRDGEAFAPAEVVRIGVELARALSAVHDAGLLHRDIKAKNVMLAADGRIVLMDFGAGREFGDGGSDLAGTPLYLAPEVFHGEPATIQSDIYSLGVLLYHLLTNTYPVCGETVQSLRIAHERQARVDLRAVRSDVPTHLARVIERLVDSRPSERHANTEALIAQLTSLRPASRLHRRYAAVSALIVAVWLAREAGWLRDATRDRDAVSSAPVAEVRFPGGTLSGFSLHEHCDVEQRHRGL